MHDPNSEQLRSQDHIRGRHESVCRRARCVGLDLQHRSAWAEQDVVRACGCEVMPSAKWRNFSSLLRRLFTLLLPPRWISVYPCKMFFRPWCGRSAVLWWALVAAVLMCGNPDRINLLGSRAGIGNQVAWSASFMGPTIGCGLLMLISCWRLRRPSWCTSVVRCIGGHPEGS